MKDRTHEDILFMLKALADESRLALLRMLNEGEQTVGNLASQLELGEPTASHHLTRLREAGLVTLRMAGNQRFYRVNESGLARFKHMAAEIEQMPPSPDAVVDDGQWINQLLSAHPDWSAEDIDVLREHIILGRITRLPSRQKKLLVILRWLATLFQPGNLYSEVEVNNILKAAYPEDFVSLRRDLVDFGYLRRERGGGKYWLAPADEKVT